MHRLTARSCCVIECLAVATWPVDKPLEPGFSGDTDLAVLPDG